MSEKQPIIDYDDKKIHTILVADDSKLIRKQVEGYLLKHNYDIITAEDGQIAFDLIKKHKVSLIITDINMPNMNGFEFIESVKSLNFNIPIVMITDADIDTYIGYAINQDVGNILSKPLTEAEVLNLVYKLITKNGLFGLENYLINSDNIKTITVTDSDQINTVVPIVVKELDKYDIPINDKKFFHLIMIETLTNAVYHSYGFTEEKLKGKRVKLPENEKIELKYGSDETNFGIAVVDFRGGLTKKMILSKLKELFEKDKMIDEAMERGEDFGHLLEFQGRGISMIREMSSEYFFNIQNGKKTEVIVLLNIGGPVIEKRSHPLKINEIY